MVSVTEWLVVLENQAAPDQRTETSFFLYTILELALLMINVSLTTGVLILCHTASPSNHSQVQGEDIQPPGFGPGGLGIWAPGAIHH